MKDIYRLLPSSGIRTIFDRTQELERAGREILHLDVGLPVWHLPPGAEEGVNDAIKAGYHQYVENRGLLELRELVSEDLAPITGRKYDPETEIFITVGASEGVAMAELAVLGPGDEIIIPQPAWSHYETVALMAGATPVPMTLSVDDGFRIDPDKLKKLITPKTKMLLVNSPSNPTGVVQSEGVLKEIAALSEKHGFYVMTDEVYDRFVYDGKHISMCQFMGDSDLLIYINSFSKTFAMTGWRLGIIGAKPKLSDALNRIHQHLTVCSTSFAQKAAVDILKHPERQKFHTATRETFMGRAEIWNQALKNCNALEFAPAQGALYVFPKLDFKGMTGTEFCKLALEEHSLSIVPGKAFGQNLDQYFRISFGADTETQKKASQKLLEILS